MPHDVAPLPERYPHHRDVLFGLRAIRHKLLQGPSRADASTAVTFGTVRSKEESIGVMGGKEARGGFWFQDAKALTRLLADAIERRRRRALGIEAGPELRVRVESAVRLEVERSEPNAEATARPPWDGTFSVGDQIIVDECKLGGPTRNDRVTFYRRLRATITANVPAAQLVPRFTVGRDSIDLDRWKELGVKAQSMTPPTEPPERAGTTEKLAAEALYYLTHPDPVWKRKKENDDEDATDDVPPTPPLTIDDARALLSRLTFDGASSIDDVDAELQAQFDVLGGSLATDELVDLLGGWIGRIARSKTWSADLTADTLTDRLALIARYLSVPPATEQLWHRLRTTKPPDAVTRIAEQPWRDVQPHVEPVVRDRPANRRVVLTSEGGIGKSHLIGQLYAEQAGTRVWVDAAATLHDLENALALGAWAAQRSSEPLTVFVDAIDSNSDPAGLLATIDRALVACEGAAVYVATRFATWVEIRERLRGWRDVRMMRWPGERIRALAESGRSTPLSGDLIDLLRTPLLLDLFLRTFKAGDPVPAGLATRHGVLRAYFERRIYADAAAPARRALLDAGVEAVLANAPSWRTLDLAAQGLVSEGVVINAFGELRFRHALLRDFSAALQLAPKPPTVTAGSLRGVNSPIVRNELLRGTIESLLDPDPIVEGGRLADLIAECTRVGLAPGIALGTTDAPTAALLTAIGSLDGGAVLRQALAHARLTDNRAWLRVPSALGGNKPAWLGDAQFQGLASLAELALASGDVANGSLAETLRLWTDSYRVSDGDSSAAAKIGALLVQAVPDDATADWFAKIQVGETGFRSRFLEQLRDLGASREVSDDALSRALHNMVFGPGSHVLSGHHSMWEVTNLCLSDHEGKPGLLTTRPFVATALLFALSVETQLAEDRRDASRREAIFSSPSFLALFGKGERPPDFVEAEARLRVSPQLTETEALGGLVDDAPTSNYRGHDYLSSLIDEVDQRASTDKAFAEQLARAALASNSLHARIIVLSLPHDGPVALAIDEILRDPRVYHVLYASGAIWDAIRARWPALSPAGRIVVQQNILARARSPLLSITSVGRLASALPRQDVSNELEPYLEFLEKSGRGTEPPRPGRVEISSGGIVDDDDDEAPQDPLTARLEELAHKSTEADATNKAIALLEENVGALGVKTTNRTWYAISRVVEQDVKREPRVLSESSARGVFEAALTSVAARRDDPDEWSTLLDIADNCVWYVPESEASGMRRRLIEEIVLGAGNNAEREEHAWRALAMVHAATWFGEGTKGRDLFARWFRNHLRGEALHAGQRFLRFIPGKERVDLVCEVIEKDGRFSESDTREFTDDAGRLLAAWAMWWEPPYARERLQQICTGETRTGALASPEAWHLFLAGLAWSLQNEVRHAEPTPGHGIGVARFVPLLTLAWSAWSRVVDDSAESNSSVGWAITAPLGDEFTTKIGVPLGGWSSALRDLLPRVINEGGRNDIGAFQQVDWPSVDAETIARIADAAISRADREITSRPATDWMIGSLIEILARAGVQPSLPLANARRVLDCLQRLGRDAPAANTAAISVERDVRSREASHDRSVP
jgi:hypothetical protein